MLEQAPYSFLAIFTLLTSSSHITDPSRPCPNLSTTEPRAQNPLEPLVAVMAAPERIPSQELNGALNKDGGVGAL